MEDTSTHRAHPPDVHLVLSPVEAGQVLESLVSSLRAGAWAGDTRENMTALALFIRDYLCHPIEVPATSPDRLEARTAA
jgi:hypothetical protein